MKTRVFAVKGVDLNYADNKSGSGVNTAVLPYDLEDGNIGIYGVHKAGSTNYGKLVLITDGGSEVAGKVPAASFVGQGIQVAIGRETGCDLSGILDITGLKCNTQAYVAPVKRVQDVGYTPNQTAGVMNEPSTIIEGDEFSLGINVLNDVDKLDAAPKRYSGSAQLDGDSNYSIILQMVKRVDADTNANVVVDIHSNGTPTYKVGTEDPTVTNGSKTVTFATDPSLSAGNVLTIIDTVTSIAGTYVVAEVVSTTEITLDRVYKGTTETIDVSVSTTNFGTLASITEYGFTVTDRYNDAPVDISLSGIFSNATTGISTAYVAGVGTGAKVAKEELESRPMYGNLDQNDRRVPIKSLSASESKNYEQYHLIATNVRGTSDPHNNAGTSSNQAEALVCFDEATGNTGNENASMFEDILASLGVSVSTLF